MASDTWDPATATAVTLSGGNLVATNTGTSSADQGVKVASASGKTSGKYYFELTFTTVTGGGNCGVGVSTPTSTYTGLGNNATTGVIHYQVGSIYASGSSTGITFGTLLSGTVIEIAVDLDNRKWWSRPHGSNWNNSGTANPATNVGGVTIPAGTMVPVCPFGPGPSGNVYTANFGASAFVGTVPSGFTAWSPAVAPPVTGHYFGVAERWDRGHWDVAHWNGQLGISNTVAPFAVTGYPVGVREGHILTAQTGAIAVQGIPVICRAGRGTRAQTAAIVLTGIDIAMQLNWHAQIAPPLDANSGMIEVTGIWAELKPFLGAGTLNFGIPLKRPGRW